MKTKFILAFSFQPFTFALLATLALGLTALPARAQDNNVTISAAAFQSMVYGANLHTQLALKPELQACLSTMLQMQRRNPNADPMALADVSRQALQFYRTNEPVYLRTNGYPDEILAAYLDALRNISAHTNFVPANLTMLNYFMLGPADTNYLDATNVSSSVLDLINSADQRLSSCEGEVITRQTLVDDCVARAQGNVAFATAMDSLLVPETGVSLQDTPAGIIGDTNSPLYDSPTMQTLLALSEKSGNGSVTVSSNQLMTLFGTEMQTIWDTANTNLAMLAQINQSYPDLLAALTNQAAIDAKVQLQATVQQLQPAKLACATAAVLVQSQLLPVNTSSAKIEGYVTTASELAVGIGELASDDNPAGGIEETVSGGMDVANDIFGTQSQKDVMANQISNIQTLMGDLNTNINLRFDQVDESLTNIFDTMNQQFSQITMQNEDNGQALANLQQSADDILSSLVTVQSSLDRIEAEDFASFSAAQQDQIIGPIDNDLLYAVQYPATRGTLPEVGFGSSGGGYEADEGLFYKYALNDANDAISSPSSSLDLSASDLQQQLAARPLDANLNYIQQFLTDTLGVNTVGTPGNPSYLSNPQEWFIAAYAYLQLAGENPMYFRKDASQQRVSNIIGRGHNIANFCSSLTLTGTNINWNLWNALKANYSGDLLNFNAQVSATETAYANTANFNLGAWRQWDAAAPRVTTTATTVLGAPAVPSNIQLEETNTSIAAGGYHGLALKADGTVAAWGDNTYSQTDVPASAANVVAISGGYYHSLALLGDGCVVAWGAGTNYSGANWNYGQSVVPSGATSGVIAVAAGGYHSLVLKADGTLLAWGLDTSGQTNILAGATNVIAIAAGHGHSLALKADGSVVCWGDNSYGETNVPPQITNVVAIASWAWHCLALRADGALIGWGRNDFGQATGVPNAPAGQVTVGGLPVTNVVAITAGFLDSLAVRADGTVVAWGAGETNNPSDGNDFGQSIVPPDLNNVVAVAGGFGFSLALQADGTVVGWGDNTYGETNVPAGPSSVVAIAAGYADEFGLALQADGMVAGWGDNTYGEVNIPPGLNNVVAIAAGGDFSLALKADGTVVGWGDNGEGQATGVANTVSPYISSGIVTPNGQPLSNVVAIAASDDFSLALQADGTVVGWGYNYDGEATGVPNYVPPYISSGTVTIDGLPLTNVVAISAGWHDTLALRADGTVVGWGWDYDGQATGVPNRVSPYISSGIVTIKGYPLTNVVAISAGGGQSLFLTAADTGGSTGSGGLSFAMAEIPANVVSLFQSCNQNTANKLAGTGSLLDNAAGSLVGDKLLLEDVLELGMPYTLERDGVLHGFLYGSESLVDTGAATDFLQAQNALLQATPNAPPQSLTVESALRYVCFQNELNQCLTNLQATGQPEIPRLVGQTLRLLNLLNDAWTATNNTPPPALEVLSVSNKPSLLLYGEPYVDYILQSCGSLTAPNWTNTAITGWQDGETNAMPFSSSPQGYYRALTVVLPTQ